jgi:hypothetical protein
VASVAALLGATGPASAYAPLAGPAFSLTVSPTRLVIDRQHLGDVQTFQVINGGRDPLDIRVQKRNFTASVDGALEFQADAPYSASEWVDAEPSSFRLSPHTTMNVKVRITMPVHPEPGDHQVALVFVVPAGDDQSNIHINRGIGAPIYIAVPGVADDSVQVDDLVAPRFSLTGPISFATTIHDVGTMHRDFRGTDRLGVHVGGDDVLFPEFTVLRGTDRRITTQWRDPPMVCFCHATVSVTDASGVVHLVSASVTIFPAHLIAIALVLGLLVVLVVRQAKRRYRRQVLAAAGAIRAADRGSGPVDE